jgi:subtilisin family serine protease
MLRRKFTTFKILVGMLMPVFLFILLIPQFSQAQIDSRVYALSVTSSDPFFTVDATDFAKQWYLPKIKIPETWDYTKGNNSVVVAIVDTGIHASHIELNDGRVIAGYNTITNQDIPANSNSDDNGHGTNVAGVIGAIPNNNRGIAGINWNIKLMPIKALAADGTGALSAVAAGIIWATDHGANIINLSVGGAGFAADQNLSRAITYAFTRNVLIVAAAGNDLADLGLNMDSSPVYPICADNGQNMVLGVAATDSNDQKANFSNFGHFCVDVSAPGQRILTTAFLPNNPSDNILIYGSGTSLAAPMVSGAAALIKSAYPNLSNVDLENILMSSSDSIDSLNEKNCLNGSCNGFLGKGRINVLTALVPRQISNGSLVREQGTGNVYLVANNAKRLVSTFVMNQRGLDANNIINEIAGQLVGLPTGSPLPPLEGTLIKSVTDPEVFIIYQEQKRPVTYPVFISRKLNFADVKTISQMEISSYAAGDWYTPPDGTTIVVQGNPLVYVLDQQVARPVSYFVFTQRHLSFAKVFSVTADEFSHLPKPADQYWLAPVDGTLVKSDIDPGIYLIQNQTRQLMSLSAFLSRGYSFSSVKTLPQAEIEIITPGETII